MTNPLDKLTLDKSHHMIGGCLMGTAAAIAAVLYGLPQVAGYVAILVAAIGGAGKELADAIANKRATGNWRGEPVGTPHGVELMDFFATVAGGALVGVPVLLILK